MSNIKILPNSLEAEQNLLGEILMNRKLFDKARNLLQPSDFYQMKHILIFKTMLELNNLDIITLNEKLTGKIKPTELTKLLNNAVGGDIDSYIKNIKEKAVKREFIKHQTAILERAYEVEDIFELINNNTSQSNELLKKSVVKKNFNFPNSLMKGLEKMTENKNKPAEFPLKLKKLDGILRIEKGNVVVIGAESSNGKTSLALKIALSQEKRVLFCSLEMTEQELIERMISTTGKIDSSKIKIGNYNDEDWIKATNAVKQLQYKNLILEDVATLNGVRKAIIKYHPEMVVIDHLQLLRAVNPVGNRSQIVGELANEVKRIAKEYELSIILLSQLSRSGENIDPSLSRLKESGDVENMADIVILMQWKYKIDKNAEENLMTLKVAKNRNGAVGAFDVFWQAKYFQIENLGYKNEQKENYYGKDTASSM